MYRILVVVYLSYRGKGNYKVSRSTFACNRVYTKELTKWHVKEFDNVIIPPKDHGIFFAQEGYVFRWAYIITVVRELEGLTPGEGMFARDRKHRKQLKQEKERKGNKPQGSDSSADEKKKNSADDEVHTSSEEEDNSDDECQRILESGGRDRAAFFFWQGRYARDEIQQRTWSVHFWLEFFLSLDEMKMTVARPHWVDHS